MTDKASPAGWVVQVTAPDNGGAPDFIFFNVAVSIADKAVLFAFKTNNERYDVIRLGAMEGIGW